MGTWDEHGDTHGDHGDTVRPWGHVEAQGMDQDYGDKHQGHGDTYWDHGDTLRPWGRLLGTWGHTKATGTPIGAMGTH